MLSKFEIKIHSLTISPSDFETICWNATGLDDIKTRKYLNTDLDDKASIKLIRYLQLHMDPIFIFERWTSLFLSQQQQLDYAMYWLRIFLEENNSITSIFPPINQDAVFINNTIRKCSPALYTKLIKSIQNF